MSLNLENQGNLIAKVMKNGKDNNMKLYVTDKENTVRNGVTSCKYTKSNAVKIGSLYKWFYDAFPEEKMTSF